MDLKEYHLFKGKVERLANQHGLSLVNVEKVLHGDLVNERIVDDKVVSAIFSFADLDAGFDMDHLPF